MACSRAYHLVKQLHTIGFGHQLLLMLRFLSVRSTIREESSLSIVAPSPQNLPLELLLKSLEIEPLLAHRITPLVEFHYESAYVVLKDQAGQPILQWVTPGLCIFANNDT